MQGRKIHVVGLGGGGGRIVERLAGAQETGALTVVMDTDSRDLAACTASTKLQIGAGRTKGFGTGGDVKTGLLAAQDDTEMIRGVLSHTDLVILAVSLGGGTGTGAAPVVLYAAREEGATTVCFATLPFAFEGKQRSSEAENAVIALRESADCLILVPNERLFEGTDAGNASESFRKADEALVLGISAVWRLITQPGYISLDLANLQRIVRNSGGICTFGFGRGEGEDRAAQAVSALLASPLLLRGAAIEGARALLVSILAGSDLRLQEVGSVMDAIKSKVREGTEIHMGTVQDPGWNNRLLVTAIVSEEWAAAAPPAAEPAPAESEAASSRKERKAKTAQRKLGLEPYSKGRFKDVEPTILDGEDMDVPTFIRRGLAIEK